MALEELVDCISDYITTELELAPEERQPNPLTMLLESMEGGASPENLEVMQDIYEQVKKHYAITRMTLEVDREKAQNRLDMLQEEYQRRVEETLKYDGILDKIRKMKEREESSSLNTSVNTLQDQMQQEEVENKLNELMPNLKILEEEKNGLQNLLDRSEALIEAKKKELKEIEWEEQVETEFLMNIGEEISKREGQIVNEEAQLAVLKQENLKMAVRGLIYCRQTC
jgi:hypothetical protein